MDKKPLLCRLGRHKWKRHLTEERETFYCCERCNKTQDKWTSTGPPPVL
jgi:hypothetical protein